MDLFTLYVGQGALAVVRCGQEAVIIDTHMPTTDHVTKEQIEASLTSYLRKQRVRGLILTGLDGDHAHDEGVDSILTTHEPDWVMYPKYYKDTDCAASVFATIERHERRRARTSRPLKRHSVRLDRLNSRDFEGLADAIEVEIFSPHIEDMDNSNNSGIVAKLTGRSEAGFSYLATGDTETERWKRINEFFGDGLRADCMAASHHGSRSGVNAQTLLHVQPHTVMISAGIDNQYGHPDAAAVNAYRRVAKHVFATNATPDGTCLYTRRVGNDLETRLVRHA
jgi:beta-lactamase superfamily II metal-dependent hydrolase